MSNIRTNCPVIIKRFQELEAKAQVVSALPEIASEAKKARNILESPIPRLLVGSDVTFLDRFYRRTPQRAANFIFKQMRALLPE